MNFLFVHQNFPGQYLHLVRSLLADNEKVPGTHEIVFMTEPNRNYMQGVRKVTYAKPPPPPRSLTPEAREFEIAAERANACYQGALQIRDLGFKPDIIMGHHGWGEMLRLCDVFPGVPILGYFEFYYRIKNSDVNFDPEFQMPAERFGAVRGKNTVNLLALALEQWGQTPTAWQHSTYPDWANQKIRIIEEGVDLEKCAPDPSLRKKTVTVGGLTVSPKQKLVTFVSRNLEPYRGFHTLMRALPKILERPDVVVSLVGGEEVSYGAPPPGGGSWKDVLLREVGDKIDLSRVHFMGKVAYDDHLTLLKRSDAHVYLSYPFVASWSLREALACGCVLVGADTVTVKEFVTHEQTGLITPTLDAPQLAQSVLRALSDTKLAAKLRVNARDYAQTHLGMADYIARYRAYVEEITGRSLAPETVAPPPPKSKAKTVKAVAKPAKTPVAKATAKPARPAPKGKSTKPAAKPTRAKAR